LSNTSPVQAYPSQPNFTEPGVKSSSAIEYIQYSILEELLMSDETVQALSEYITGSVLKQPKRVLTADTVLLSSGLVDSFSLVDLAMFIEERFGVRIHDTELNAQTFDTLGQLAELVENRQKNGKRR
jgi:acyl carrier protein